jgi:hypothetical protein
MGMVAMSKRELNRLDVLAWLDSDRLTAQAAAEPIDDNAAANVPPLDAYSQTRANAPSVCPPYFVSRTCCCKAGHALIFGAASELSRSHLPAAT